MDFEIEEKIVKTLMENMPPKEIRIKNIGKIVKITSNEAKEGTEKLVEINHANVCNKCYGKGKSDFRFYWHGKYGERSGPGCQT